MMMLAGFMMKMMFITVVVALKLCNIYVSRYFAKCLPKSQDVHVLSPDSRLQKIEHTINTKGIAMADCLVILYPA